MSLNKCFHCTTVKQTFFLCTFPRQLFFLVLQKYRTLAKNKFDIGTQSLLYKGIFPSLKILFLCTVISLNV